MRIGALSAVMTPMDVLRKGLDAARRWTAPVVARADTVALRLKASRRLLFSLAVVLMGLVAATELSLFAASLAFGLVVAMVSVNVGDEPDAAPETMTGSQGADDTGPPRGKASGTKATDSWRALVDAFPEAAIALDAGGFVLHVNGRVKDLFPKAKSGFPLSYVTRNPELNDAVDRIAEAAEPIVVQLFERVPVERRIEATVSRLQGVGDRRGLPAVLVTFRDLTEQDRLAQMRADFIANASHELRTPLASLRGFVETLQGPARDDAVARERFLGIMASQAARMTRLIDDLLSLSRVEMRVHVPPKGVVDLNEVATYVAQALEPLAAANATRLEIRTPNAKSRMRGDREEIVQVIQNLAHNALKYGREGGRVEISVTRVMDGRPPEPRLLLAVADDGPGISSEHLPRLTERFYRANAAQSRDKGGTGLGLAIVKHIVLRHRGELRIASEVGKGSTFSVLFEDLDPLAG